VNPRYNIRPSQSPRDGHADQRTRELDLAGGAQQVSLGQFVSRASIQNHHIGGLASGQPGGNRLGSHPSMERVS